MNVETPSLPNRLLRASAGTGKTYQLVELYVSLLQTHRLRPTEIVAITFTRKAALELRERIRDRLAGAQVAPDVLGELSRAPLSNFHGLALNILNTYALGVGEQEPLEVLGEAGEDRDLFVEACEDAWFAAAEAGTEDAVLQLSLHFAVDEELPDALWHAVNRARENGLGADETARLFGAAYDAEAVRAPLHDQLMAQRTRFEEALRDLPAASRRTLQAFLDAPQPERHASPEVWASTWAEAGRLLSRRGKLGDVVTLADKALLGSQVWEVPAESRAGGLVAALTVLAEVAMIRYRDLKRQRRAVDFCDLVANAVALMERYPTVRADIRRRTRAVLVDEAQDTNPLQRRFVHLLAGLSHPEDEAPPAALCVVGDRKQAIYTFRGADPASFEHFGADVAGLGGEEVTLAISRRSEPAMVAGINSIGEGLFGASYEALEPLPDAPAKADVPAGITWVETSPESKGETALLEEANAVANYVAARLEEGLRPSDFAMLHATMTTARVYADALRALGVPVQVGGGGGLYARQEVVGFIHLLAWLCDPLDRMAAAVVLRSPYMGISDDALIAVLPHPEVLMLGSVPEELELAPEDRLRLSLRATALAKLRTALTCEPVGAFVFALDQALGLRGTALASSEQAAANLDRMFELAHNASQSGMGTFAFARQQVKRLRNGYDEPVVPVSGSGVGPLTIMSVHQSKGLQFPVVLMPGLRRRGRGDTGRLRYHRAHGLVFKPRGPGEGWETARFRDVAERTRAESASEKHRLLYVGITRAERELVLFGPTDGAGAGKGDGFARVLEAWLPRGLRDECVQGVAGILTAPTPLPVTGVPAVDAPAGIPADEVVISLDTVRHGPPRIPEAERRFSLPVTRLARELSDAFGQPVSPPLHGTAVVEPSARLRGRDAASVRGDWAHAVLAELDGCEADTPIAEFLADTFRQRGGDPASPPLQGIVADLQNFLELGAGAAVRRVPREARRHELPFTLTLPLSCGVLEVVGQVDLMLADDDGLLVVDFKTGRPTEEALASYARQLAVYALALSELCGVDAVRTQIMCIEDAASDRAWRFDSAELGRVREALIALGEGLATQSRPGTVAA